MGSFGRRVPSSEGLGSNRTGPRGEVPNSRKSLETLEINSCSYGNFRYRIRFGYVRYGFDTVRFPKDSKLYDDNRHGNGWDRRFRRRNQRIRKQGKEWTLHIISNYVHNDSAVLWKILVR